MTRMRISVLKMMISQLAGSQITWRYPPGIKHGNGKYSFIDDSSMKTTKTSTFGGSKPFSVDDSRGYIMLYILWDVNFLLIPVVNPTWFTKQPTPTPTWQDRGCGISSAICPESLDWVKGNLRGKPYIFSWYILWMGQRNPASPKGWFLNRKK